MRHRSEWFLSDPTGLVTVKCRPSSMVMPVMSPSSLEPPSSPNPMSGKSVFYSERAGEFVISPNRLTKLFSWAKILIFFHSKWLKSRQIGNWGCSNKVLEQLQVLIWQDLSHLAWKKNKILAQENNLVRLFGEMTNASALSE